MRLGSRRRVHGRQHRCQALEASGAEKRIQLGSNLTEGLGAAPSRRSAEAAAEEAIEEIRRGSGLSLVFIAAGMGWRHRNRRRIRDRRVSREFGILTVRRRNEALPVRGLPPVCALQRPASASCASTSTRCSSSPTRTLPHRHRPHDVCRGLRAGRPGCSIPASPALVDLIVKEGLINLDLADVKTVLGGMAPP